MFSVFGMFSLDALSFSSMLQLAAHTHLRPVALSSWASMFCEALHFKVYLVFVFDMFRVDVFCMTGLERALGPYLADFSFACAPPTLEMAVLSQMICDFYICDV